MAAQNATGPAPAGNVTAQDNVTVLGNATGTDQTGGMNATGEIDTFNARGHVASIVSNALTGEADTAGTNTSSLEILGGVWKVDVIDGEVRRVEVNMSMAKPDGSGFHTHRINNFTVGGEGNETTTSNATGTDTTAGNLTTGNTTANETTMTFPQIMTGDNETGGGSLIAPSGNVTAPSNETAFARATLSQDGTFEISGTANMYTDDNPVWQNVPVTIESAGRVVIINVDHEMTANHFKGAPIYGFVTALIGEVDGGRESLLPSTTPEVPTAPPTAPAPAGPTAPDNETGGNQTPAAPAAGQDGSGGTTEVSITPGSSSKTTDSYDPNPVEVSVGDTVTWTNDDSTPHTVTSGSNGQPDGAFDSSPNLNPLMAPGQTFEHTFEGAGEFPYYCAVHPNMVGTVNVS